MAEPKNRPQRPPLSYLITEQDVHAYIDGELTPARRAAVEQFLSGKSNSAYEAVVHLRSMFDLRALRERIYEDQALRGEVERLLAKRTALAEAEDDAVSQASA